MADPSGGGGGVGGGGLDLLALSAIFRSVISSFFTQNKGGRAPRAPPLDLPLKPIYIWPKLHGRSQSVNVRSYSSVINEDSNVNDRKKFNLVRSSIQKVKVCFILS